MYILSYATQDQAVAKILMEAFRSKGLDVSLSELHAGINWIEFNVEFRHKDPFGAESRDVYALETKLYNESRADLRSLRELALHTKNNSNINKALIVTDGNLTSVALDWVNDAPKVTGVPIRVVDGTELKRLLLHNTDLVSKYFATSLIPPTPLNKGG